MGGLIMTPEQLKAEKIKAIIKGWGEKYNCVKHIIDSNGWCPGNKITHIDLGIKYEDVEFISFMSTRWRPKTLHGFEDNNGWRHITDKESLPEPRNHYHFISRKTGNKVRCYLPPIDTKEDKINLDFFLEQYSHWRPIYEVPGPIY